MLSAQWRPVRSATTPVPSLNTSATASPAPVMSPTRAALAPNVARYGPTMLRAPSYTKSASRLTTPNATTNLVGDRRLGGRVAALVIRPTGRRRPPPRASRARRGRPRCGRRAPRTRGGGSRLGAARTTPPPPPRPPPPPPHPPAPTRPTPPPAPRPRAPPRAP